MKPVVHERDEIADHSEVRDGGLTDDDLDAVVGGWAASNRVTITKLPDGRTMKTHRPMWTPSVDFDED